MSSNLIEATLRNTHDWMWLVGEDESPDPVIKSVLGVVSSRSKP
jgi:hypothetical protein